MIIVGASKSLYTHEPIFPKSWFYPAWFPWFLFWLWFIFGTWFRAYLDIPLLGIYQHMIDFLVK